MHQVCHLSCEVWPFNFQRIVCLAMKSGHHIHWPISARLINVLTKIYLVAWERRGALFRPVKQFGAIPRGALITTPLSKCLPWNITKWKFPWFILGANSLCSQGLSLVSVIVTLIVVMCPGLCACRKGFTGQACEVKDCDRDPATGDWDNMTRNPPPSGIVLLAG